MHARLKKLMRTLLDKTLFAGLDYYVLSHLLPLLRERLLNDFETHQQGMATWSTAAYLQAHMPRARALPSRKSVLQEAFRAASQTGLLLEFGVFQGESINFLASLTTNTIHGFDSFEGLPEDWKADRLQGAFALDRLPRVAPNVVLHKGWFEETLPYFVKEHPEDVSFIHVDCDLYASTQTVLRYLGAQIKPGTVIVFDEYFNYPNWQAHEFAAFQEFVEEWQLHYQYLFYRQNGLQVAVRIE